ncbi:hypothetical protein FHETE_1787 [Fusarium heterosporum]|uniref:Uncharacterized protein n=1 Tax=Fusarium heterosporum TaxID=42747 RepID=A0A8H5TRX5_FUSHE|nr:hypothetical protein FHETE_1787 [Fusarium heterosporum]
MGERPAIYVHLEMGLSLPKIMSKDRHITYISKGMRDRANQFPRQLPPANTNYLDYPVEYPAAHQQMPTQTQPPQAQSHRQFAHRTNNILPDTYNREPTSANIAHQQEYQPYRPPQTEHSIGEYYAPASGIPQKNRLQTGDVRRSSRSTDRSSHERGKSAPPPLNSSPWDVTLRDTLGAAPQIWKALPATPNQFRLGEGDMPWDAWSFPMGVDDNNEDGDHNDAAENRTRSREASLRATWGPEFQAEPSRPSQPVQVDDRARREAKDIQSLASALMTVDNGFEDQWWYQGPRLVNTHGTEMVPTAIPHSSFHPDHQQSSVGWAVCQEEEERQRVRKHQHRQERQEQQRPQHQRHLSLQEQQLQSFSPLNTSFPPISPRSSVADIVSPLSDFSSPISNPGGLRRSLTTRSDTIYP